jgi:molybdopterin synthase sulfur carrier subunit
VRILYFAWLREKVGISAEEQDIPPEITDVGQLIAWLSRLDAAHAAAFAEPKQVRCAIDLAFAAPDASILGASEIAFFPPVTGG